MSSSLNVNILVFDGFLLALAILLATFGGSSVVYCSVIPNQHVPMVANQTSNLAVVTPTTSAPLVSSSPNDSSAFIVLNLVNTLLIEPLVNFNNRVSAAAGNIPNVMSENGKQIGSTLARPLQATASGANNLLTGLNSTLVTVANTSAHGESVLALPFHWANQRFQAALELAASKALNTASWAGSRVHADGERLASVGQFVQDFAANFTRLMEQMEREYHQHHATSMSTPSNELLLSTPLASTPVPSVQDKVQAVTTKVPSTQVPSGTQVATSMASVVSTEVSTPSYT